MVQHTQYPEDPDTVPARIKNILEIFNRYGLPPLLVGVGIAAWFGLMKSPFTQLAETMVLHLQHDAQRDLQMQTISTSMMQNTWLLNKIRCETRHTIENQLACFKEDLPIERKY